MPRFPGFSVRSCGRVLIQSVLAFASITTLAQAETGVSSERILLGQSAAFSGPAQMLGIQMNLGAKLYFDSVNAQGGIHGRKIAIQTTDDTYEASTAAENTKDLIENDKVFALFGYVGSSASEAAIPLFTKAKVPFFAPLSGAVSLRNPLNRYIFNIRASYTEEAVQLVRQLEAIGVHRIGVFYQNDADGKKVLQSIEAAVKQHQQTLIAVASIQPNSVSEGSTDMQHAIALFMEKKPEVIVLVSPYGSSTTLIKELHHAGYPGQFQSLSMVGSRALSEALGKEGNGIVISQAVPSPWSPKFAIVEEYRKAMEKSGQKDLDFTSLEGFIAAKTFVEIIKHVGRDLTREKFIAAAENLSVIELGNFPVRFSPTSREGSQFVDIVMIRKDGKFLR